ncbi:hypothetical protein SAMN05428974_1828 [Sphingopyxis sp. YR583]|jgi:hypothetical protein|uniref:hypothetical protein n=1 Tax=Sphingopyxis sp. YR583 TaxID=1881047 RepID=UPI0008A746FD|nr:hypothetical protein [Sphingopyxis sp. YR583]SEH16707.1 hypothetical protein SAMN05428974_1828 [Sphingopyxis sp. YR583]
MNKACGRALLLAMALALSGCGYAKKAPEMLPPAPGGVEPYGAEREAADRARQEAMAQQAAREQQSARSEAMRAYEEAKAAVAQAKKQVEAARKGHINFPDTSGGSAEPAHMADSAVGAASDQATVGKVACPQLGGLATPEECANYSGLLATMQSGVAAFDPPRRMDMGRDYPVKLVIGAKEVAAQVVDSATDAGDVKTVDIRLGSWICAELLATQFELNGPARQCKERGLSRMLSFDWTVSPKQDGKLKLGVKVESLAEQNGKPLDTIDSRMIAVDVEADAIGRFDMMVSRLTDSIGGVRAMLLALVSALGVLSVVVWRIRNLGKKPEKDALKDLASS